MIGRQEEGEAAKGISNILLTAAISACQGGLNVIRMGGIMSAWQTERQAERGDGMKYFIQDFIDVTALVFLYAFVFFKKWRIQGKDRLLVNTLMYAYLSLVLYVTMMPVIVSIPFMLDHPYKPMNLAPFIDVSLGRGDFFRQVFLNVVMTLPFGFLFPLTRGKRAKFGATVFSCFLMSLGIELLQPFFDRSSDITDLITNVIGGALGYGLYVVFRPVAFWVLERLKTR